ncbi:nucleotidyltransferase family protein [Photobacterium nomapromontoriensis]|uniref:nucleotidyltransferase family protein n=1 Tax=Photobacterium nomapromontoriensis TaxID=2910237 RepID=UPI003D0BFE47
MNYTFLLNKDSTLRQAIKALDDGGIGFLAFIDIDNKLKGILTDGDIRRAILNKEDDLFDIINKKPVTMSIDSERPDIIAKLKSLHRRHMPLVDNDNTLISVFSLDDIEFVSKENTVVIMAGGLGSRLGDLTKKIPKPMLPISGKPMLQHLLESFRDQGFFKFIICVNYKKDIIIDHFGNGDSFSVSIEYIDENIRMGTAGALSLIKSIKDKSFFVINADVLTNMDFTLFLEYHEKEKAFASMAVRAYEHEIPFGVVESNIDNCIRGITEKPSVKFNVNAGVYILDPRCLDLVPKNEFYDMPTFFTDLVNDNFKCKIYHINDYWIDIGRKEELIRAEQDFQIL